MTHDDNAQRNLGDAWNAAANQPPQGTSGQEAPQQAPAAQGMPWQNTAPRPRTQQQTRAPKAQQQPQIAPQAMRPNHPVAQMVPQYQQQPQGAVMMAPQGQPVGKIRDTGICILLSVVTFGIYGIYWLCVSHSEMKRHTGQGFGGVAAFFISFIPFVITFLTPSEVGRLYQRANRQSPVSGASGFWAFVPVVGWLILFIKINGALNDYWRLMGAGQQY